MSMHETHQVVVLPVRTWNKCKNFFPESDIDQNKLINESNLISVDYEPEVVFDDETCKISMPKIFEDDAKFSEPIFENMAKFMKMGCTQKSDLYKFLKNVRIVKTWFHL